MEYFEGKKIRIINDNEEIKNIDLDIIKNKNIIDVDKYLEYSNELIKKIKKESIKDNNSEISNGINSNSHDNFLMKWK